MTPEEAAALLERGTGHVLLHLLEHLLNDRKEIMSALDDINTSIDGLTSDVQAANAKADALIALTNEIAQMLSGFEAAGGASPDQLAAMRQRIEDARTSLNAETAKEDAAITADTPPAPPPPPAPAPAPAGS